MRVLERELALLEQALSKGRSPLLPDCRSSADFAEWQRQRLQGELLERELRFWKMRLADLPVLELPCDRPRPALPSVDGERQLIALEPTLVSQLHTLGGRQGRRCS